MLRGSSLAVLLGLILLAPSAFAAPSAEFTLSPPDDGCVAGSCRVAVLYDTSALEMDVIVEVDWGLPGRPRSFEDGATVRCSAGSRCTATSPVYAEPGRTTVIVRVTDSAGVQATSSQPLVVLGDLCGPRDPGVSCGPGNGRRTPGGGDKVPHTGWPAVTGILWKVNDNRGRRQKGGPLNDELLGHHGSDRLDGAGGHDILWGDWDPRNNNTRQRDVLSGGPGNDWLYPSHGPTTVRGGAGKDHVWAYYGRGTIDCGPGRDTARVRLNSAFKVRNCETINHFCGFGSDGMGGCLKPGEKRKASAPARPRSR